jgi:hypothetical protein
MLYKLNSVPSNDPHKNDPEYIKLAEDQKKISEEINDLDKLRPFTPLKLSNLNDINHFLLSSKYISKDEASEIKNKFQKDLENLKSYEKEGKFYDKDHFVDRAG